VRSVRLPDALWHELQRLASIREISVSTVIYMALNLYVTSEIEKGVTSWEKR